MNGTYDSWKTTDPTDTGSIEDECPRDCEGCPVCQPDETNPDEPMSDEEASLEAWRNEGCPMFDDAEVSESSVKKV